MVLPYFNTGDPRKQIFVCQMTGKQPTSTTRIKQVSILAGGRVPHQG